MWLPPEGVAPIYKISVTLNPVADRHCGGQSILNGSLPFLLSFSSVSSVAVCLLVNRSLPKQKLLFVKQSLHSNPSILCVWVWARTCFGMLVEGREQSEGQLSPSTAKVLELNLRLGSEHHYPLSQLG